MTEVEKDIQDEAIKIYEQIIAGARQGLTLYLEDHPELKGELSEEHGGGIIVTIDAEEGRRRQYLMTLEMAGYVETKTEPPLEDHVHNASAEDAPTANGAASETTSADTSSAPEIASSETDGATVSAPSTSQEATGTEATAA